MLRGKGSDKVELQCPECGVKFETTQEKAEKGQVRCPKGHEFAVMGMLGSIGLGPRRAGEPDES